MIVTTKSEAGLEAKCVRLNVKAADAASIEPDIERRVLTRGSNEALIAIDAAGVNPSDIKAATGLMPYAVFPRTPGRDFSGVVIEGPTEWIGKAVFGTSGDLGIRRDGTHASHVIIETAALVEKPPGISMEEAAGIGVPFVTAIEGFRRTGMPKVGERVVIMGINGKVGQVAAQLATWQGAQVIGVVRKDESYQGHANGPIEIVDSTTTDVTRRVRELTEGKGADIVFNTVGDPYFDDASHSLARGGRQILIAATGKAVAFNILQFYRGRHTYVGIDSLAFSSIESADILRSVLSGFAEGFLKPFPIAAASIYPLSEAKAAYTAVSGSSRNRIVLRP